jgi:hypothetical protein
MPNVPGLDQRQPDQRPARARVGSDLGHATAALLPPQQAEHAQRGNLGEHQPAVAGLHQILESDADQSIDHTGHRHRHEAPQRHRREPPCGEVGVLPAAQGMGQQRQ